MPIPQLDQNGLLPSGHFDATLDEIAVSFGQTSSRRSHIRNLQRFVEELQRWPIAQTLYVNGSFVTGVENPNDVDVILVLRDDYDLRRPVSPVEYNLRSNRIVRRAYGLDLFAVRPKSLELDSLIALFSQVRDRPGLSKGILRVTL